MTRDQAINELIDLQKVFRDRQTHVEQDGTSDFMMFHGAIAGLDVAIDIVKEIN